MVHVDSYSALEVNFIKKSSPICTENQVLTKCKMVEIEVTHNLYISCYACF